MKNFINYFLNISWRVSIIHNRDVKGFLITMRYDYKTVIIISLYLLLIKEYSGVYYRDINNIY